MRTLFKAALLLFLCATALSQEKKSTDYFKKWLDEDVDYIITPEERVIFKGLRTDAERESFIEDFWKRRDSDPATSVNETREEHYRRIAYANAHYGSGKKGWKTDRGMMYIKYGPPAEIDAHPAGGSYKRPFWEGGGTTSTFPFEVWTYRHLEGIGDDVEIEFVDPTMSGEYRMARDPLEKDALLFVPGAGNTLAEANGAQDRVDRIKYRATGPPASQETLLHQFQPMRVKDYPLERMQTFFNLQRPADIKFKDLQTAVNTRVFYNNLPFQSRTDQLQIRDDTALVRISLELQHKDLTFTKPGDVGIAESKVEVFGQVEGLRGNVLYAFEDVVGSQVPAQQLGADPTRTSRYQKSFPLPPGRYKLTMALKDMNGNKVSTSEQPIIVDRVKPEQLGSSSLMLTDRIIPSPESVNYLEPFTYFTLKFYPSFTQSFAAGSPYMRAYLEVYDLGIDQQTGEPAVEAAYEVMQGTQTVLKNFRAVNDIKLSSDRAVIFPAVPLKDLAPGTYELRLHVTDKITGKTLDAKTPFTISDPPQRR